MAPVILALRASAKTEALVVSSGQHRELLPQALEEFGLHADRDLGVMVDGQTLPGLTARVLEACTKAFNELRPDAILVHGDTTTAMAGALAGFYARIPVGHVEAGLRTGDRYSPFPEEMNRCLVDRLSEMHFAPTTGAETNLRREGISGDGVFVTGNTGIDALLAVAGPRVAHNKEGQRLILVEAHRRENLGAPIRQIAAAVQRLVSLRPDIDVVWSVHPNPEVAGPVREALGGVPRVRLVSPPPYRSWARLLAAADVLLVDSGGLQEEAPALGLPVLILRESTERPEVVACGAGALVGTSAANIVDAVCTLLDTPELYRRMASAGSPFGDGEAARRTLEGLLSHFDLGDRPDRFGGQ